MNDSIFFHNVVVDLFRPFIKSGDYPADSTPTAIFAASIKQTKRLVYIYRCNFEASTCSILWHSGLLYVMNEIIQSPPSQDAHFYYLLCLNGYRRLARGVPIVTGIVQSLFYIAVRQGAIMPVEANEMYEDINNESKRLMEKREFRSRYPIDRANPDIEAAGMVRLTEEFEATVRGLHGDTTATDMELRPVEDVEGWKGHLSLLNTTLCEDYEQSD